MATQTPVDSTSGAASYAPRDPVFYLLAVCMLSAALQPAGLAESDRDMAESRARELAAVLDGGPVPADLVLPRFAIKLEELTVLGAILSPTALNPTNPLHVNAGDQTKAREKAKANGVPTDPAGLGRYKEKVIADHAGLVLRLSDLSEPVRASALWASCTRIGKLELLTGAPHLLADALGIVVEEIERAIRMAESLKLPTRSMGRNETNETAETVAPYPANIPLALFQAARRAEDGDEAEPPTDEELRARLAEELRAAGKTKFADLATAPEHIGAKLLEFAAFVDETIPGTLSPPLRAAFGLAEARA